MFKYCVWVFFAPLAFSLSINAYPEQLCRADTIRASTPEANFLIEPQVVADRTTGLMWQRCFVGQAGAECTEGSLNIMSWPAALKFVEQLNSGEGFAGYRNWRLPNIKELASIAEVQCANPAINPILFPNAPAAQVWSSSPYNLYPHYSWLFDFRDLTTTNLERFKQFPIILVRTME